MPLNYQTAGTLGAAGGAGILGSLGRFLEPLDYPRQALWNVPGKLAEGDFLGAAPGILGLLGGGALAATGIGLPAAMLGGSLLGGLGQGIGRTADEERFRAPAPSALTSALGIDPESGAGMATNLGLGMAGDPLTWAGGGVGKLLGSELMGSKLGGSKLGRLSSEMDVLAPAAKAEERINPLIQALADKPQVSTIGPTEEALNRALAPLPLPSPAVTAAAQPVLGGKDIGADLAIINKQDKYGLSPLIPDLYDKLKTAYPGMTEQDFHAILRDLAAKDKLTFKAWGGSPAAHIPEVTGHAVDRFPDHPRYGKAAWISTRGL